jgi:hypothetical protein
MCLSCACYLRRVHKYDVLAANNRVCTHYRAATLYRDKTVMTPIKKVMMFSYNDEGQRQ